ncbi:hypothetical protein [Streptomyces sp. NPDC097640]|uniref:hypothetical protein n=1 Tax=Streptomyces sp. NPDC097640 TaxID=3157229 RepID=UPI00331992A0
MSSCFLRPRLGTPVRGTHWSGTQDAIEAYRAFDRREQGWTKVALGIGGPGSVAPGRGAAAGTGAATTAGAHP